MVFGISIDAKKKRKEAGLNGMTNMNQIKKIGKEVIAMKRAGESQKRIHRELNHEVFKYTNANKRG